MKKFHLIATSALSTALLLGLVVRLALKPTNSEEAATVRSWGNIGIMVGLMLGTIGILYRHEWYRYNL